MAVIPYLEGGETADVDDLNALIGEADRKLSVLLAGGKSFFLAYDDYSLIKPLMGHPFFFHGADLVYSNTIPFYPGASYDHAGFSAAVVNVSEWDADNRIAKMDEIGSLAYPAPYVKASFMGLFDHSLEPHTFVNPADSKEYYLREALDSHAYLVEQERRHDYAVAEIILEDRTTLVMDPAWDKYGCYRLHNLNRATATVDLPDGLLVSLDPYGCKTVRRYRERDAVTLKDHGDTAGAIATGQVKIYQVSVEVVDGDEAVISSGVVDVDFTVQNRAGTVTLLGTPPVTTQVGQRLRITFSHYGWEETGMSYLWNYRTGDPRFFHLPPMSRVGPGNPGRAAWMVQTNPANTRYANNLLNFPLAAEWMDVAFRGLASGMMYYDCAVHCDSYARYQDRFGDPNNDATLLGDLIHHRGMIRVVRIPYDAGSQPAEDRQFTEDLEFKGYGTIVADFAAAQISVTEDPGTQQLVLRSLDMDNEVYLLPISTNLFKQGEAQQFFIKLSERFVETGSLTFYDVPLEDAVSDRTVHGTVQAPALSSTPVAQYYPRQIITTQVPDGNLDPLVLVEARGDNNTGDLATYGGYHWISNKVGSNWPPSQDVADGWFGPYCIPQTNGPLPGVITVADYAEMVAHTDPDELTRIARVFYVTADDMYYRMPGYVPLSDQDAHDLFAAVEMIPEYVSRTVIDTYDTQSVELEVSATGNGTQFFMHKTTVGDLKALTLLVPDDLTGSLPDDASLVTGAQMVMTPTGPSLTYQERVRNLPNAVAADGLTNSYGGFEDSGGALALSPGDPTYNQSRYAIYQPDPTWLERTRRVRFFGHGWGQLKNYAGRPLGWSMLYQSPLQPRALYDHVFIEQTPDGTDIDFTTITIPHLSPGAKMLHREDLYNYYTASNPDEGGKFWALPQYDSVDAMLKNQYLTPDFLYAAINTINGTFYHSGSFGATDRNVHVQLMADHYNMVAEIVNACDSCRPLSWRDLKFHVNGSVLSLYGSGNLIQPNTDAGLVPVDAVGTVDQLTANPANLATLGITTSPVDMTGFGGSYTVKWRHRNYHATSLGVMHILAQLEYDQVGPMDYGRVEYSIAPDWIDDEASVVALPANQTTVIDGFGGSVGGTGIHDDPYVKIADLKAFVETTLQMDFDFFEVARPYKIATITPPTEVVVESGWPLTGNHILMSVPIEYPHADTGDPVLPSTKLGYPVGLLRDWIPGWEDIRASIHVPSSQPALVYATDSLEAKFKQAINLSTPGATVELKSFADPGYSFLFRLTQRHGQGEYAASGWMIEYSGKAPIDTPVNGLVDPDTSLAVLPADPLMTRASSAYSTPGNDVFPSSGYTSGWDPAMEITCGNEAREEGVLALDIKGAATAAFWQTERPLLITTISTNSQLLPDVRFDPVPLLMPYSDPHLLALNKSPTAEVVPVTWTGFGVATGGTVHVNAPVGQAFEMMLTTRERVSLQP